MAINVSTSIDAFNSAMQKAAEIIKEEILVQLQYLGEECVTKIRKDHPGNWMDQTGNLRASIGAAVYEYGKRYMQTAFEGVIGPEGNGSQGSSAGREYIESLAKEYAKVYALVVVAGMDYADCVETKRDVLEGAKLWAEAQIEGRMRDAKRNAEIRINRLLRTL